MQKQTIFTIGDIHGCYNELKELLNQWNPEKEQLVLLGDLVDRGPKPYAVVQKAIQLQKDHGAIVLLGNHERMLLDWLDQPEFKKDYYYGQGGYETINSFFGHDITNQKEAEEIAQLMKVQFKNELEFLESRPLYYEWEDFVFVHAGVNLNLEDWKNTSEREFYWIRDEFHFGNNNTNKTFIFGHTPTSILHKTENKYDIWTSPCNTKICLDGGAVYGGYLHGMKVNKEGIESTHSVLCHSGSNKYQV